MKDQWSVEMLAFNFASRTFAYKKLAQGLSRFVSAFFSFMRNYLSLFVKVDELAQYVDDIGIAAKSDTDNTGAVGQSLRYLPNSIEKITVRKCHFDVREVKCHGSTISPAEFHHKPTKLEFSSKVEISQIKQVSQGYLGSVIFYRNYIRRLFEKLNPF